MMTKKANKNKPETNPNPKLQIDARLLLPDEDWDTETAQKLNEAIHALDLLTDALANSGIRITPPDMAAWMMRKALDAHCFGGFEYSLLQVYKNSRDIRQNTYRTTRDIQIISYFHNLLPLPTIQKQEPVDILELYWQLTYGVFSEQVGYRQRPGLPPKDAFSPPPPEDIPDLVGSLNVFINQNKVTHPLIRLSLVFAELAWIQPFITINLHFNLLLMNHLTVHWTKLGLPVLDFERWLSSHRKTFFQRISAYHTEGAVIPWIRFFLEGFTLSLQSGLVQLEAYKAYKITLVDQLKELDANLQLEKIAPFLLGQPAFSRMTISRFLKNPGLAETIVERLLDEGIVQTGHDPEEEPLYVCPETLAFWEQSGEVQA